MAVKTAFIFIFGQGLIGSSKRLSAERRREAG
jgi:hypothetical protein